MPEKLVRPNPLEPHPPNTRAWRAVKKAATSGSLAGLIIGQLFVSANSIETPFGSLYGGNLFAALGIPTGLGAVIGAAIGWLSGQQASDERAPYGGIDPHAAADGDDEPIELGSDELAPAAAAGTFFTANGRGIFLAENGSCYVDFGTGVKKFSSASAFRRAYDGQSAWTEVTDPEQIAAYKAILCRP